MKYHVYAAVAASLLLVLPLFAETITRQKALELFGHLDAMKQENCFDPHDVQVIEVLGALKNYLISDDSLTEQECELLIEKIAEFEPLEQREATRKKLKNKIYGCLAIKGQLLANNLTVCHHITFNNLTVNGSFDICGVPGCTLAKNYSLLASATSCDIPLTIVVRDETGSFAATTITLTGNSLINYSPSGACSDSEPFIFAPTSQNTFIGLGANSISGSDNVSLGYYALGGEVFATVFGSNNVAVGSEALGNLGAGSNNVAIGSSAFFTGFPSGNISDSIGIGYHAFNASNNNTGQSVAIGSFTLALNDPGQNVAIGFDANDNSPTTQGNVAVGWIANAFGYDVALGAQALQNNSSGSQNVAIGYNAANTIMSGLNNVIVGYSALSGCANNSSNNSVLGCNALSQSLTVVNDCIAVGYNALYNNNANELVAVGSGALENNSSGVQNTAVGYQALQALQAGNANNAFGYQAGLNSLDSNNIYIGANVTGNAGDDNVISIGIQNSGTGGTYIGGIYNAAISDQAVFVNGSGQLGTILSSKRYKENIYDMGDITQGLYKLRPVVFNYTTDPIQHKEFGLIAEEVQSVYPEIVITDQDGLSQTVQYQYLPMMMLNEMQKNHMLIADLKEQNRSLQVEIDNLKNELVRLIAPIA